MNLNTLSFTEVIRKFENYYGVRITIDNPEDMPELKYHGKIRVSDGVDHALKLPCSCAVRPPWPKRRKSR